jgi:F-box-like
MAALEHPDDSIEVLFPPEIWIHVFSFLPTRDLYSLLLVDQAFYRFAVPLLYESVYWKTEPRGLLRVLPSSLFLVQDTNNLIGRVRKCTVLKGDDRRCRQTNMPWDSVSPHVRHISRLDVRHNTYQIICSTRGMQSN